MRTTLGSSADTGAIPLLIRMPSDSRFALVHLSGAVWVSFWGQGEAHFHFRHRIEPGVYNLDLLLVDTGDSKVVLGADSVDIQARDEEFPVAVWIDSEFGQPNHEVMFRPRRSLLSVLPEDLQLAHFAEPPRTVTIVRSRKWADRTVESALVFEARSHRLLVQSWPDPPLNILLSMNHERIDSVLQAAERTMTLAEWCADLDAAV